MSQLLSTGLDILVLVFLGATIYYALKLSKSLNNFRRYRAEFDKLLDELTRNIDQAQRATHNLKIASSDSGKHLDKIVKESKSLISELQIVNESARTAAARLESLLEKNRVKKLATGDFSAFSKEEPEEENSFTIQDRDVGPADTDDLDIWEEEGDFPDHLQSQAERELYSALRKGKKFSSRAS